jgi:hypothetical protein
VVLKYHIILETNGTCKQLSQRAQSYTKAVRRARKLAREMYPDRDLTKINTGAIIEEYTQVYIIESE